MINRSSNPRVEPAVPPRGSVRSRVAPLLLISLAVVAIAATPWEPVSGAPSCEPGWSLVAEYDNSFKWEGAPSTTWQPHAGISASWTGSVRLLENLDADCTVLQVLVEFTGPAAGGTVTMLGYKIGLSYSVQHPAPIDRYADVPLNAYGDAVSWNPDGYYFGDPQTQSYYAHTHIDINERGADEYFIGTLPLAQDALPGTATPAVITNVYASFSLPLDLRGTTVYAQIHLYPDLCQCSVTAIPIPGA
jgi:hypothetical protein